MHKILFVVNPKSKKEIAVIKKQLTKISYPKKLYSFYLKSDPIEVKNFLIKNAENYDIIASVGGDGTNHLVLNSIMKTKMRSMAIIPAGTGNDLAKTLSINNSKQALKNMIDKPPLKIDVGRAGKWYFLNTCSMGFDSSVIRTYNKFKLPKIGAISYLICALSALLDYEAETYKLSIFEKNKRLLLFSVCNGRYFGGGFKIAPMAELNDGTFDLIMIKDLAKPKILKFIPKLLNGSHIFLKKYVVTKRLNSLELSIENDSIINLDGELYSVKSNIEIDILPSEIFLYGAE